MSRFHHWLNIQRDDVPILGRLALPFVLSAAVGVMLASASKGLFLASNDISRLPLMFLGSAALTALASLAYLSLIARTSWMGRASVLLLGGAASLLALRAYFLVAPQTASLALLLWGPTIGHLTLVQTWNLATTTLPTRQAKRLVPVLAALTTAGAAAGGGLVRPLLAWLSAEDLLIVVAAMLLGALAHTRTRLRPLLGGADGPLSLQVPPAGRQASKSRSKGTLVAGLRSIVGSPLLADLALFVFLLQLASVVVDYQFSAELKPRYGKEGIASFLGLFYMLSNLLVLLFTLRLTSRLVRALGVGLALAASALVIGLGSAAYVVATLGGMTGFWVLATTVFAERVAQYGMTKPAMQLAYMPLNVQDGERAKTLIDGVIYRLATALVSVLLIYLKPTLLTQVRLSLPVVLACLAALVLGWRVTSSYRKALFDALRGQRLDPEVARDLRDKLGSRDLQQLEPLLRSNQTATVLRALNMVHEFALAVPAAQLDELLVHDDERVVVAALGCLEASGGRPSDTAVAGMLAPERPAPLLRAVVQALAATGDERWSEHVRPLVQHPDPSVAAAACVLRIRAIGAVDRFAQEVAGSQGAGRPMTQRLTGMTQAGEFARELPQLVEHSDPALRRLAIEQMGQLPLPVFVAPLIACLIRADARAQASAALLAHGDTMLTEVATSLDDEELPLAARAALLKLCEQHASAAAVDLVMRQTDAADHTLRGQAVKALWRLTSNEEAAAPEPSAIRSRVLAEIALLQRYGQLAKLLKGKPTARRTLLAEELQARREGAERRALRLLGMIDARAAVKRVLINYRSPERRVRSNALELLEQHLHDKQLLPLVGMIERRAEATGSLGSQTQQPAQTAVDIDALLADDRWLRRLWQWAEQREPVGSEAAAIRWADRNDRMLYARRAPMLADIPGEQWHELATALKRKRFVVGDVIIEQGAQDDVIYWLMEGSVAVRVDGQLVAQLQPHQCFGEMAVLERHARSASVVAVTAVTALALDGHCFRDALELQPALQRQLADALVRRLRAAISTTPRAPA